MTRIRFEPSGHQVEVAGPEALIDVLDELPGTAIPLSCRSAHCGACRVRIEAGASSLWPAEAREQETLLHLGMAADERLACQLRIRPAASEPVILRVLA